MDKASDFGSEDCEFESRRGRVFVSKYHYLSKYSFANMPIVWETKVIGINREPLQEGAIALIS